MDIGMHIDTDADADIDIDMHIDTNRCRYIDT